MFLLSGWWNYGNRVSRVDVYYEAGCKMAVYRKLVVYLNCIIAR